MNPLNVIKQLESALTDNWFNSTVQKYYREFNQKKWAFIRDKLTEKGFGHLIEGMDKRMFPKIKIIHKGGWDYYYADNDTDEGAFIVAIKDETTGIDTSNNSYQMKIEFQWQDKFPIVDYIKK